MTPEIKVTKRGEFGVVVKGLEGYLGAEDSISDTRRYRWDHSITINYLYYIDASGEEVLVDHQIIEHLPEVEHDQGSFMLENDGHYMIAHIVIPTKKWIEDMVLAVPELPFLHYKNLIYFEKDAIYIIDDPATMLTRTITLEQLYEIGPNATEYVIGEDPEANTVVKAEDVAVFFIPRLERCFNGLIKDLLKDVYNNVKCPNPALLAKERERDLIWMFINAIKYARDYMTYYEAQRLLERLGRCNTICGKNEPLNKTRHCGC